MYFDNKIEFQAERDLGSRINVAFDFIKRNFLPLTGAMLVVITPLLAIGGAAGLLFFRYSQADNLATGSESVTTVLSIGLIFILYYFVLLGFLPASVVFSYIKLYREQEAATFSVEEVLGELKKHWLKLLGAMILTYAILLPAFLLFIIPGVYLAIPLLFVPYAIVAEDMNVIEAISRAFQLVKNHWWETFGLVIVAAIINYLFSYIFQLPFVLTFGALPFLSTSTGLDSLGIWGILASIVYLLGNFIIQVIPLTMYAFHYHHLVEIKEGTGLLGRISKLGRGDIQRKSYTDEEESY
ncbi:hypothetical protein [Rhodoflexus sp.]